MHRYGAEVFASTALDDEDPEKTNLMFFTVHAKRVVDQSRQLWKVRRGKTPGSSGWMKDTEIFVAKFEQWWFTVRYRRHDNRSYTCRICHKDSPRASLYLNAPRSSRRRGY
eukprot:6711404-Karenia_brevis.AAC.1